MNILNNIFKTTNSDLNAIRSELTNEQILSKLRDELKQKKKSNKQQLKEGDSKFKPIYEQSQQLYNLAIQQYKNNNLDMALIYYELANYKYSYYLSIKKKYIN